MDRPRARRDVLNDARRTVERNAMVAEAARSLAEAAERVLGDADDAAKAALRAALESYRQAAGQG